MPLAWLGREEKGCGCRCPGQGVLDVVPPNDSHNGPRDMGLACHSIIVFQSKDVKRQKTHPRTQHLIRWSARGTLTGGKPLSVEARVEPRQTVSKPSKLSPVPVSRPCMYSLKTRPDPFVWHATSASWSISQPETKACPDLQKKCKRNRGPSHEVGGQALSNTAATTTRLVHGPMRNHGNKARCFVLPRESLTVAPCRRLRRSGRG